MRRPPNAWLWLAPCLACLTDGTVTFAGQRDVYWEGSYELAREDNPLARPLLALHPLAFGTGLMLEAATLAWIAGWWRLTLAIPAAVLATLGHATGIATWCISLSGGSVAGWVVTVLVFVVAERVLHWTWPAARAV